ncbi:MAG: ornithine carbamoyltransferase [Chloroflexi bacterium]|nr:ornithine carbamoyltransferase [Chloroflexota bacterium]
MSKRDFLSITDLSPQEVTGIIQRAEKLKGGIQDKPLAGKSVAMLFEKPSLRTKVSFDVAVHQMGGHPIYLGRDEVGLGGRESVGDVARVLSRYVNIVVARTNSHQTLEELAACASIPVVNALSDVEHPCQALGDMLTMNEHMDRLAGLRIAYIGDGNNVAASLALAAASVGASCVIASPPGYELPSEMVRRARALAAGSSVVIDQVTRPEEAVEGADVVYTDVWVSMGQEAETEKRLKEFQGYQVSPDLMELAKPGAIFMHPLPAHRGEEVSEDMLDYPKSVVFDQAENRLHAQKAILEMLVRPG